MTVTAAGVIQVTLPSVAGFTAATINYALNAPAVGASLPLSIDSSALNIVDSAPLSYRNRVINGNFDIWQRGTSQTSAGYGSDDRWNNFHSGSTKTHSQQTFALGQTDVPGNPKYFSRTVVSSVAGAANNVVKIHKVEDVSTFAGETATLSFWAKADAAKNIAVEFVQEFGTGGSPSASVTGIGVTTCALTTSWKKFTITVAIPSISGKTLGTNNDHDLAFLYWFDAGSNFNARTNSLGQQSGTFDISGVQLEVGSKASAFERRPYGMELQLAQRYYFRQTFSSTVVCQLQAFGAGDAFGKIIDLPVPMRVAPTTCAAVGSFRPHNAGGAIQIAFTSTNVNSVTNTTLSTTGWTGSSGLVAGYCTGVLAGSGAYIEASAEL
jgi:hypothetical protein